MVIALIDRKSAFHEGTSDPHLQDVAALLQPLTYGFCNAPVVIHTGSK